MYGAQFHLISVGSDLLTLCSCYFTNLVPKLIARYSYELPRPTNLLCLIDELVLTRLSQYHSCRVLRRNLYLLICCVTVDLSFTSNVTKSTIFNRISIHFTIATRYHWPTQTFTDKIFRQSSGIIDLLLLTQIKSLVILTSKPLLNNVASKVFPHILKISHKNAGFSPNDMPKS